ncbi:MAG: hypothetical protein GY814_07920, partial [Gammaproteobacteria bacterium]|nr:hypothetical protein [Gammaproteobacteria bacterium]
MFWRRYCKINSIFKSAVEKARGINAKEDLSAIKESANDELFRGRKPILTGIDTRSLYCYILSAESHRDEETWAIHFLDSKDKGLNPERTIGDDGSGLVAGHKFVFPKTPYDYDNFHLAQGLMDLRRFFRNQFKSAITALNTLTEKERKSSADEKLSAAIIVANEKVEERHYISTTLDTLISWLEHDILNKSGPTPEERHELYDFVVTEFKKLELIEEHRIKAIRTTLENQK